jgi:hypothetical protein
MNANDINLLRAIRWPITLITLGTLFALNNFSNFGFNQTWPVLLIVFGLLSLAGRATRPTSAEAPPGPAPGGSK